MVRMGYSDTELQAGLAKSQGHVSKFVAGTQGRFATMAGGLKSGLSTGLGFLGIGAGVAGMKAIMDEFDRIKDLGEQLNQTPEAIQKIGIMAQQSGSDVEAVARALNRINKELARPQGRSVLKELGMDAAHFKGLEADQQVIELAEAFQKAEAGGKGLRETYDLIGKSAAELLPLLRANTGELREMAERKVVTNEQVQMIGRFNDGLDETIRLTKVGAVMLGDELAMALRQVGEAMRDLGEGDELGSGMDRFLEESGAKMGDEAAQREKGRKAKVAAEELKAKKEQIEAMRVLLMKERDKTMNDEATAGDKLFKKRMELARLDDEIKGAQTGGSEAKALELLTQREVLTREIGGLVKENLREIDAQVEKQRELRDVQVELKALQQESNGHTREATALRRELGIRKEAEALMKRHNMSEQDALTMARERADLEDRIANRDHGRKDGRIRGYTNEQRENSKYNNPHRGLDELDRMNRKSRSDDKNRLFDDHLKTPGLDRRAMLNERDASGRLIVPVGSGFGGGKKGGSDGAGKGAEQAARTLDAIEKNTAAMARELAEG